MTKKRANNEGTIVKRSDGRWEGKLTVGIKKDGSPDRQSVYGRTQKEAKEKLELLKADLRNGTYVGKSDLTVGNWVLGWIKTHVKVGTRSNTYDKYLSLTNNHILPKIGNVKLQSLRTGTIQKLFAELLESGNVRTKGELSSATVAEIYLILNQAFNKAIDENIIKKNPVTGTTKPKVERKEFDPYSEEEMNLFLSKVKDHMHYTAFYLECYTGLRRGELLGLKWHNVDFNKCSISVVRSSKSKPNGKTSTKTRSSVRIIDLGKNVMSVLSKHKAEQDARKAMLGSAYVDNNLVFCQATGKPLCPRAFARSFERALAQHKLRKIRFHDLRHTHATMLLLKGIPIHVVSKRLGHSSIRITLEYYSHVIPGMQEQVVDLINQMTENVESEAIKL